MEAVYGAENSVLKPAEIKLVILNTAHMTADIVTPPGVASICGAVCKIGLEIKTLPADDSVTREAEGIAMATETCVS